MGMRIETDIDAVIARINGIGKDATREAYDAIVQGAKEVRDLARQYAPVDDHILEKSIIEQHDIRQKTAWVGIDPRNTARNFQAYAAVMHEFLSYGSHVGHFKLGPGSKAKDGRRGVVGGKYLTRAIKALKDKIISNAAFKVKRVVK